MMMRRRALFALVAALAMVAAACGAGGDGGAAAPGGDSGGAGAEGTAPLASAELVSGGAFDEASIGGGDAVLWFWAPWCTVCRSEAPGVAEAAEANGDVPVVGVAGRGEVGPMQDFVDETGVGSLRHVVDDDGSLWASYGVTAQPAYAFIDDGEVVDVKIGALGEEALSDRMAELTA